jgi:cold shock CspA family protein/ribosome-associated translation inhibitor RaiA
MQIEPEIAYRNVEPTQPMENQILRGLAQLERTHPRIIACRIMVEIPHPRHVRGNLYRVRIDITVPGREIVVSRDPPARRTREEARTAIREAFDLARSQLREKRERDVGRPRVPQAPLRGQVISLEEGDDYGFIQSSEGDEVYFHRTGVPDGRFDDLEVGSEVRFVEEEVEGAIRAVSVFSVGRGAHHPLHSLASADGRPGEDGS